MQNDLARKTHLKSIMGWLCLHLCEGNYCLTLYNSALQNATSSLVKKW